MIGSQFTFNIIRERSMWAKFKTKKFVNYIGIACSFDPLKGEWVSSNTPYLIPHVVALDRDLIFWYVSLIKHTLLFIIK
jgi:hypothetical protein